MTISAESLFSASSKDSFVLVLFSKNKFAIVISLKLGTFFIGLLMTSLNCEAVSNISLKSSVFKYFIPNRCETLSLFINHFFQDKQYFDLDYLTRLPLPCHPVKHQFVHPNNLVELVNDD